MQKLRKSNGRLPTVLTGIRREGDNAWHYFIYPQHEKEWMKWVKVGELEIGKAIGEGGGRLEEAPYATMRWLGGFERLNS
jgi:hypothetical protein